MPEPVSARRTRVLVGRERLRLVVLVGARLGAEAELVVRLVVLLGRLVVPVPVSVLAFLGGGDQLREHARERVDLVAAQLRAGGQAGRPLREHALQAEHQRVADLPLARRRFVAGGDLLEGVVEGTPTRGAGPEHDLRILFGVEERLAGPGFCAEGVCLQDGRCLRLARRVRSGF